MFRSLDFGIYVNIKIKFFFFFTINAKLLNFLTSVYFSFERTKKNKFSLVLCSLVRNFALVIVSKSIEA